MNKLIGIGIGAIVVIIAIVAILALFSFKPSPETPPTTPPLSEGAAENLAYGAVEQELDQAASNITEQDIQNSMSQ